MSHQAQFSIISGGSQLLAQNDTYYVHREISVNIIVRYILYFNV